MSTYPWLTASFLALFLAAGAGSCVPNGPATKSDAGAHSGVESSARKPVKPPPARSANPIPTSPPLTGMFEDNFDRSSLGSDWYALSSGWELKAGKLCGRSIRNRGVWLNRTLPLNARIEFEAMGTSAEGDIKAEYWGDGRSGATGTSYSNASSYLSIFGGWKNTLHVLTRINEHAPDRLEVQLSADSVEERERPVVAGRTYGFKVERADGKTVSWWVDGVLIHSLEDKQPLSGPGHDHFGFNDWEAPICFDNLKITPL